MPVHDPETQVPQKTCCLDQFLERPFCPLISEFICEPHPDFTFQILRGESQVLLLLFFGVLFDKVKGEGTYETDGQNRKDQITQGKTPGNRAKDHFILSVVPYWILV